MRSKRGKEEPLSVRTPIRLKYTLIFAALFTALVAAIWVFNQCFLKSYYSNWKLDRLKEVRIRLEQALDAGETTDGSDTVLALRRECERTGISALVLEERDAFVAVVLETNGAEGDLAARLFDYVLGRTPRGRLRVYESSDEYMIVASSDAVTTTEQLDCVGTRRTSLTESEAQQTYYYILSASVANITETVDLVNRFLLFVGAGGILIGAVLVYLISRRITRPVQDLTSLSRKMSGLDFSARYEGTSHDEIHVLGENMNEMADTLEETIGRLKDAHAQLEKDIREKEKVDRQRRELLANISHDLKTPIALIEGYAEGLKDGILEDAESREEYCTIILDEAARMNRLVRQLLNLNELESGMIELDLTELDLAEILRGAKQKHQLDAADKKVRFEGSWPDTLPVRTDGFLVEDVLQNYLSNAFQHVPEGGTVRLSAYRATEGTVVEVFNSGEPIPEESLEEIWDKFYRVDKARTRSYGGSGIGLSIVKAATERLGGRCGVRNGPDGVIFWLILP